jgi:hypothetical protein
MGQSQGDAAYLLDGVKEIASGRNLGQLCVFGDSAFPLVDGRTGHDAEAPAIAGARLGSGRVVALTGYLEDDNVLPVAYTSRMLLNIGRWAAGGKKAPRAGVYKIEGLAARAARRGLGCARYLPR